MAREFVGREVGALVARARFVDPYVHLNALLNSLINWRGNRTPLNATEHAGVAMG